MLHGGESTMVATYVHVLVELVVVRESESKYILVGGVLKVG